MKKVIENSNNSLCSYIENNRTKIDEALVSLRLMKKIDEFLEISSISQRDFASNIGCSEAYISQLMSGTKKFNTSFINNFEKKYNLIVDFKIRPKNEYTFTSKFATSHIVINVTLVRMIHSENVFSFESKPNDFFEFNSSLTTIEL